MTDHHTNTDRGTSLMTNTTFETVVLTADAANAMLAHNRRNRPVKQRVVDAYADDMANGRWRFTAEPIKVDEHGTLLDGQHRCLALIAANADREDDPITIKVLIVRGLETSAQDVMDSGTRRSVADQLSRRGSSAYSQIAAAIRCILIYKTGKERPSRPTLIQFYDDQRETLEAGSKVCTGHGNTSGISPSALLAAWFLIGEACDDLDSVASFFHLLQRGVDLPEGSPILAIRNRALNARLQREAITNPVATMMVLRAWNAWRTGQPLKKAPIRTRGTSLEVKQIEG